MRFGRKGVSVLAQGALTDIRIESSPDQQHWLPEQSLPVTPKVMAVAEITGAQHYARLVAAARAASARTSG
jgi:hypothetical protein